MHAYNTNNDSFSQLFCAENQSVPKDPNHRGDAANGAMYMPRPSSKTEGNNIVELAEDMATSFKLTDSEVT